MAVVIQMNQTFSTIKFVFENTLRENISERIMNGSRCSKGKLRYCKMKENKLKEITRKPKRAIEKFFLLDSNYCARQT